MSKEQSLEQKMLNIVQAQRKMNEATDKGQMPPGLAE